MDCKGSWNCSRNFRSCKLFRANRNLRYYDGMNKDMQTQTREESTWLCPKTRLRIGKFLAYLMKIMLPQIKYCYVTRNGHVKINNHSSYFIWFRILTASSISRLYNHHKCTWFCSIKSHPFGKYSVCHSQVCA